MTTTQNKPGTDLAIPDNEYQPTPLTEAKAKQLDKRIRAKGEKLDTTADEFIELLEQAGMGSIHVHLGFKSWPMYVTDVAKNNRFLQLLTKDRNERKALVAKMYSLSMSQRAIADALGVTKGTVQKDLDGQVDKKYPPETTGKDGKMQTRRKSVQPKPEPPIDAEVVDYAELNATAKRIGYPMPGHSKLTAEAEKLGMTMPTLGESHQNPALPKSSLTSDFRAEVDVLVNAVDSSLGIFKDIMSDPGYGKSRRSIAKTERERLQHTISKLEVIADDLNKVDA